VTDIMQHQEQYKILVYHWYSGSTPVTCCWFHDIILSAN
jgi:hypothetical protein